MLANLFKNSLRRSLYSDCSIPGYNWGLSRVYFPETNFPIHYCLLSVRRLVYARSHCTLWYPVNNPYIIRIYPVDNPYLNIYELSLGYVWIITGYCTFLPWIGKEKDTGRMRVVTGSFVESLKVWFYLSTKRFLESVLNALKRIPNQAISISCSLQQLKKQIIKVQSFLSFWVEQKRN